MGDATEAAGATLEIGRLYRVKHARKGTFTMVVKELDDEWCKGVIVDGEVRAMQGSQFKYSGEVVTMRRSFCVFTRLD